MAWRFARSNWAKFVQMWGHGSFTVNKIITEVTSQLTTHFDYKEAKSFFDSVALGAGKRTSRQCLERIKTHVNWLKRNEAFVTEWLRANVEADINETSRDL